MDGPLNVKLKPSISTLKSCKYEYVKFVLQNCFYIR